ncbi:Nab3 protein [Saccharomycopsis crataegensis]|uniref:Nab3 protein n=1 Tax=Saccharomycopsis crataegensis TaxID=43959 RepID=A0AAV5QTE2_9ASCO|nr:Nab3 protein [Saccharomycopsis crataegensis]
MSEDPSSMILPPSNSLPPSVVTEEPLEDPKESSNNNDSEQKHHETNDIQEKPENSEPPFHEKEESAPVVEQSEEDEDYDPAHEDFFTETQKDGNNTDDEEDDDEYNPDTEFGDDTVVEQQQQQQQQQQPKNKEEEEDPSLAEYVMSIPFINHPLFLQLDDTSKKVLIEEYTKNPSDSKFDIFKDSSVTAVNLNTSKNEPNDDGAPEPYDENDSNGSQEAYYKSRNKSCKRPSLKDPMNYQELEEYGNFVRNELEYLTAGNWDKMPPGSRMFIGNLPVSSVTKQILWRIFKQYGEVVQITIKSNYGFCQFKTAEECANAIKGESSVPLHGKMMLLEVSKPQKSKSSTTEDRHHISNPHSHPASRINTRTKNGGSEYIPLSSKRANSHHSTYDQRAGNSKRSKYDGSSSNISVTKGGYYNSKNNFRPGTECQVYVKHAADPKLVSFLLSRLSSAGLSVNKTDISPQMSLKSLINDAAYSGVYGIIVVHRDGNLDVQTFEKTDDGGVKFDEYQAVSVDVAVELFMRSRGSNSRNGGDHGQNNYRHPNNNRRGQTRSYENYDQNRHNNSFNGSQNSYGGNPNMMPVGQPSYHQTQRDSPQQSHVNPDLIQTLSSFDQGSLQNLLSLVKKLPAGSNASSFNGFSQPQQPQQSYQQPPPPPVQNQYQSPPQQFQQQYQSGLSPYQQQQQMSPSYPPHPPPAPPNQFDNSNTTSRTDPNNIQSLMQTLKRLQGN